MKLLLIDGNNVMFRAYYATAATGNLMRNKKGFPTNMLYGFINIYNKVISDGYTHVAICFDKGSKTRRHLIYKDYKAGRAKTPDELIEQIPYLYKILDALNVKYFMDYDYEADDIIASLSSELSDYFDEVDVLSNDNDLFQLIDDKHFQLYNKQKENIKYSKDVLFTEKGITPIQIPDYKALIGDKSDNLKGVEGIGPVGAAKLLSKYNTLDGIYGNLEEIGGKNKEKLINSKEDAYFTLDLARLNPTFKSNLKLDDFKIVEANIEALKEIYMELDFNNFLKKLSGSESIEFKYTVTSEPEIESDGINYLYLELLGDNYHKNKCLGFGLSNKYGNYFISMDNAVMSFSFNMFLTDSSIKKTVYDFKMIYVVLKRFGIEIDGVINDILLESYVLDPEYGKMSLSSLSTHFGIFGLKDDIEIYGKHKDDDSNPIVYSEHIAKKASILKELEKIENPLLKERDQESLLLDIELPFSKVLGDMELIGLRVDTNALNEYEECLLEEIKLIEKQIYNAVGHEFNILSPKQLGEVLFDELGLKNGKKTKTGYSTSQEVLEELRDDNPVIDLILRFRLLSKIEGTYVLGVKAALDDSKDDHIHTIYKQALTDTGRISSIEPNLQNLPIRNSEARSFRKIFIPEDNCQLISSDYSQIELRVMAHLSNDSQLINAFLSGRDIHSETAKLIFNKSEVSDEERRQAKIVNFGILYGISGWGLSKDLGVPAYVANDFINYYHSSFKNIKPYTDSLIDCAKELGYVKTMFNRRRYIRDIDSPMFNVREFAKRTAMNAPIQGTAADILKIAMVNLDKALTKYNLHSRMILTIHDEIVLNTPKSELEKTLKLVKEVMEGAVKLSIPLKIESSYGSTLYEAK